MQATTAPTFTVKDFREALGWFATGVAIITTRGSKGEPIGLTANSFNSVSLEPPLVLFSLNRHANSLPAFQVGRHFAVNILSETQKDLSARFANPKVDKWRDVALESWESGCPILPDALASFDCQTELQHDGGDHVIFIGRVLRMRAKGDGRPLLYCRGGYCSLGEFGHGPKPEPLQSTLNGLEPWFAA